MKPMRMHMRTPRECRFCGQVFWPRRSTKGIYCSRGCYHAWSAGPKTSMEERFWRRVSKQPSGCWLWTGKPGSHGYGQISTDRKPKTMRVAHRLSWELHRGPIPSGLHVLHNCPHGDNKLCVNPDHLYLGTQGDHNRDSYSKGQNPGHKGAQGANNRSSRFTEADVLSMRARYAAGIRCRILAHDYQTAPSVVWMIVTRRAWKHLP